MVHPIFLSSQTNKEKKLHKKKKPTVHFTFVEHCQFALVTLVLNSPHVVAAAILDNAALNVHTRDNVQQIFILRTTL